MTVTGPFIVIQRRPEHASLHEGDCREVCAACGERVVVSPVAEDRPWICHNQGCARWGSAAAEASRYEDGTLATVDNWPDGIPHMRVLYREAFATLEDAAGRFALPPNDRRESMAEMATRANIYDALRTINVARCTSRLDLPDGSVIEVEATNCERLYRDLSEEAQDEHYLEASFGHEDPIRAAWNAEHGIGLEATCAFGPEGEHHTGELVPCAVCDRPTCDYCGRNCAIDEGDWLCPDHAPEVGLEARA